MNVKNYEWLEQLCLPREQRPICRTPWGWRDGTIATNGWVLVYIDQQLGYRLLNYTPNYSLIGSQLDQVPEIAALETTVGALRRWAGDWRFMRCDWCRGRGWFDQDDSIECSHCSGERWFGFDGDEIGNIGGLDVNLKLIAGVVGRLDPGPVRVQVAHYDGVVRMAGLGWRSATMSLVPAHRRSAKRFREWTAAAALAGRY